MNAKCHSFAILNSKLFCLMSFESSAKKNSMKLVHNHNFYILWQPRKRNLISNYSPNCYPSATYAFIDNLKFLTKATTALSVRVWVSGAQMSASAAQMSASAAQMSASAARFWWALSWTLADLENERLSERRSKISVSATERCSFSIFAQFS